MFRKEGETDNCESENVVFNLKRSFFSFLTTGNLLNHHVLFPFVVIMAYLLISGFLKTCLLLLNYIILYFLVFL